MIKELTAQQIFEKVAKHLAKQGKQAMGSDGDVCQNYGVGERRCAVGCLIPRSFYRKPENVKYRTGNYFDLKEPLAKYGIAVDVHSSLLSALQIVHDGFYPKDWARKLKEVAKGFDLQIPEWLKAVA